MTEPVKTIQTINDRIKSGQAVVLSQRDIRQMVRQGRTPTMNEVDVVTLAWSSSMSGTAAMLLVPVAGRGVFTRADKIWLNGVEGFPGPAPNERLGVVDTLIFADQVSRTRDNYTGADLMVDLLRNQPIKVVCRSIEGGEYENTFVIGGLQFARLYIYNAFLPWPGADPTSRQPDHTLFFDELRIGDKILVNGAVGLVAGAGTRDGVARRALSLAADMFEMNPDCLSAEAGSNGLSTHHSLVLAVPIRNQEVLSSLVGFIETFPEDQPGSAQDAAALKGMLVSGGFLLTDSDRSLGAT
jgi:uncharacterized protein (DUF39 family)